MTKKSLVRRISERSDLPLYQAQCIVQHTIDAIVATLVVERRLELRGFGVFEVKKRAARRARNPRTGESVQVPEKWKVMFKPSREMSTRVQSSDFAPHATCETAPQQPSCDAA